VENLEISRVLDDVAVLLEISGANPFRIRAYQNAARIIESHSTPLKRMVAEEEDLTELPGIGKGIAADILQLLSEGRTDTMDDLAGEIPLSLIEITRLPGVGAKRVRKLWQELEVETIDDLEHAAQEDQVAGLAGFGAKSQEKILRAIAAHRRRVGRFKLADADQYVEPLLEYLRGIDAVERIEVAGSYRRRRETVGDIDLLAIAGEAAPVVEAFTAYDDVSRVELAGDTKVTVVLRSGLQVDLRILPPQSYGAALQYFTGSKEHNLKLRKRAVAQGLSISEYGVFRVQGGDDPGAAKGGDADATEAGAGEPVAAREEADVYAAVGLPWFPPELREDRGEIEAALAGSLPHLIELGDVRGDLQMHSTWSDGKSTLEEMLDGCLERGYQYFAITDHSKALAMTGGLDAAKLRRQWEEIAEIAARRGEIRILRGMEVDILADGTLDLEPELLQELDIVLASVHSRFDLPKDEQTERVLAAVRHPQVNVLAHPTGRLIGRRDAMNFDLEEVLRCAAEHGVVVELNAHPERLDLQDTHLMRARELGLKVSLGTDAHRVEDLALMRYGVEQARRAWLEPDDVINTYTLDRLLELLHRG
jgi:DNA polymerase (family 10)